MPSGRLNISEAGIRVTFVVDDVAMWAGGLDRRFGDGLNTGMRAFFDKVRDLVRDKTPYRRDKKKGYGGHIQESWVTDYDPSGMGAIIGTGSRYGPVLEEGLYLGLGPRTEIGPDGGIYSSQAVGGMIAPLLADPDGLDEAFEALMAEMGKGMGGV